MSDELNEETIRGVLSDPDSHSVEEVVAAMAQATVEDAAGAQQIEAQGRNRQGIAKFVHPSLAPPDPPSGEKLGKADWKERAGWFQAQGTRVNAHAIAGALHGTEPGELFTQAQVQRRLDDFLKREAV